MIHPALADAVLSCFAANELFSANGEKFQAVTETDLAARLREKGWKLPQDWLSEVEQAGFTVRQVYLIGDVARAYSDGSFGRRLSKYNTLITL
jgi:hypothetical protein